MTRFAALTSTGLALALAGGLAFFAMSDARQPGQIGARAGISNELKIAKAEPDAPGIICGKTVDVSAIDMERLSNTLMFRLVDGGSMTPPAPKTMAVGTVIRTPQETCLTNAVNAELAQIYDEAEKVRAEGMAQLMQIAEIPPDQKRKMAVSLEMANANMRQNYVNFPHRNLSRAELEHLGQIIAWLRNRGDASNSVTAW
jgi:hypothetical protein